MQSDSIENGFLNYLTLASIPLNKSRIAVAKLILKQRIFYKKSLKFLIYPLEEKFAYMTYSKILLLLFDGPQFKFDDQFKFDLDTW